MKTVTIKISESAEKSALKYGKLTPTCEKIIEGFVHLQKYTLNELKSKFTKEEWTAMIDAQNGLMLVPDYQANVSVFLAHCEDFELLENGFFRHNADFKKFKEKAEKLTSSQVYFLQAEIDRFWNTTSGSDLFEFIENIK